MLTLNDGRAELWQWDTNRELTVDADCSQVHFSNKVFGRSIDVDVVDGVAIIPDILLQTDKELTAWAFVGTAENGYTKISKTFKVNKRNKPADYAFTPQDQSTLGEILDRIEDLENRPSGDVSKEDIQNAVNDYLDKNPVSFEEKDPTVPEWAKKPQKPTYTAEEVGAQPEGDYILRDELPEIPEGGIPIPETAEVGQTIVVKAVDENGKPTEWEAESKNLLPFINRIITTEDTSAVYIDTDADGNPFDVTEYELRVYIPNGSAAITVETAIAKPTWSSFFTSTFKKDGMTTIQVRTCGNPHWIQVKYQSYRSPRYEDAWTDGLVYDPGIKHATSFVVANWSGVIPTGMVVEVYGR
jgi:hypothetical protein